MCVLLRGLFYFFTSDLPLVGKPCCALLVLSHLLISLSPSSFWVFSPSLVVAPGVSRVRLRTEALSLAETRTGYVHVYIALPSKCRVCVCGFPVHTFSL